MSFFKIYLLIACNIFKSESKLERDIAMTLITKMKMQHCIVVGHLSSAIIKDVKHFAERGVFATYMGAAFLGHFIKTFKYTTVDARTLVLIHSEDVLLLLRDIYSNFWYEPMTSSFVWLVFDAPDRNFTTRLRFFYIPYNCRFLIAVPINETHYHIDEIYNTKNNTQSLSYVYGTWSEGEGLTAASTEFYDRRLNMRGTRLVFSSNYQEFCALEADCKHAEIWIDMGRVMNFTTVLWWTEDTSFTFENPYERAEADVSNRIYDSSTFWFSMIGPTFKFMGYLHVKDNLGLDYGSATYLRPFPPVVWTYIFIWLAGSSVIIVLIEYWTITRINQSGLNLLHLLNICLRPLESMCNQCGSKITESHSSRTAWTMTRVAAGVIVPAYSAAIISFLTISIPKLPFTDLQSFIQDGSYQIGAAEGTYTHLYFNFSSDPLVKIISKKFLAKDMPYVDSAGITRMCEDSKFSYLACNDELFKEPITDCKILKIPNKVFSSYSGMMLRIKSPYTIIFNKKLTRFYTSGILQKMGLAVYSRISRDTQPDFSPIELPRVKPLLTIIFFGQLISLILFGMEIIFNRTRK